MAETFLNKHDPVRKAQRSSMNVPRKMVTSKKRVPIPASLKHQVSFRDQGQCQAPGCRRTRWTEIHQKVPVAMGGRNEIENLITLCSGHRLWHFRREKVAD